MKSPKKLKLKRKKEAAAGFPSIFSAAYYVWEETYVGRGIKTLFKLNQEKGYDCPSCAWPDPDVDKRSAMGEYCENGAKSVAWEATKNKVDLEFFEKYTINDLLEQSDHWLEKQGRITHPVLLTEGSLSYKRVSWPKAYRIIAEKLNSLDSPDEATFYTSGRASNEAAFMYQSFVRLFGTNNLPDCSNMCHEASGKALSETTGIGKASVTLNDLEETELLIIIGQNPGTNAPRMLSSLQKLKKKGGQIIAINPMPEAGFMKFRHPQKPWEWIGNSSKIQDLYLQVKINEDIALLKAIIKILYEEDKLLSNSVFDHDFIKKYTNGYQELVNAIEKDDLNDLIYQSGVPSKKVYQAASMIRDKKKIIIAWAMGVTQHRNGENTIREIVNLLLLKGAIGKPGAGTLPVRGHSNVQGDRTMGIWENAPEEFLDRLGTAFDFQPPRKHGYGTIEAVKAMLKGKTKVFFALGGNFIKATPDTESVSEGMKKCDLTVHIATKLNRSHLVHGKTALILPCLGRTEIDKGFKGPQFVTTEDTAGRVRMSMGDLPPVSEDLKSEVAIICELAANVFREINLTDWIGFAKDYNKIRDKIEEVIPGFEDFNNRVKEPGGFYLPNGARECKFNTKSGKAHFSVTPLPDNYIAPGHFVLMTIRSHDQFNTSVYGLNDRYRGIHHGRDIIMMHKSDLKALKLQEADLVNVTSYFNGEKREIRNIKVVPYEIARGCAAMYFPEGNALISLDNKSPESNCPASKFVEISIEKAAKDD